jgi:AGCS family alanine or glycine:cation symporter
VGSAAIAHAAAKTEYPVREGIVALLEPFIDTVVICTMSAVMIVLSGAFAVDFDVQPDGSRIPLKVAAEEFQYEEATPGAVDTRAKLHTEMRRAIQKKEGARLTSLAMDSHFSGLRYLLAVAVFLFAYSTMISWSYYGERCTAYLFGDRSSLAYRIVFLAATFLGSIVSATNVLDFGDLMILGMAVPNGIGLFLLAGSVSRDLKDYWGRYQRGEFPVQR